MPLLLVILAATLDVTAAALLVYWGVGLGRLIATLVCLPTARHGVALAAAQSEKPSVCAVIPAHNEEASIEALARSLVAQDYPKFHAVLCLDRCTDSTTSKARAVVGSDPRFTILEIAECPADWAGKVNAVWQGVQTGPARGAEVLLFADADTVFEPRCVSATVALIQDRGLDLLSLLSTLNCTRWFEYVVQPAAGLELVRQYPMMRANRRTGRRRAFANGQFMMFRREAYQAVGGHQGVKDELLEDLALSRKIADAGRPAGLFFADGMLTCRMYESWEQFKNGWKRIYIESAKCKVGRLRQAAVIAMVFGSLLPELAVYNLLSSLFLANVSIANPQPGEYESLHLWGAIGIWLSAAGLLVWLIVIGATYRIGRVPLWAVPGSVVGSWLVSRILGQAATDLKRGITTKWGGREYVRRPR